jgi:hypothetical protein
MRWWAWLSDHRTRCLKQLFCHDDFKTAFDDLLDIPGLWGGMRISTLNKMISIRCDEVSLPWIGIPSWLIIEQEVLSYLTHIKEVWFQLLHHDKRAMQIVDQVTVREVELMAPNRRSGMLRSCTANS